LENVRRDTCASSAIASTVTTSSPRAIASRTAARCSASAVAAFLRSRSLSTGNTVLRNRSFCPLRNFAHCVISRRIAIVSALESLGGLVLVLFVALMGGTVVATALPRIVGALNGASAQAGHRFVGSIATRLVRLGRWPVAVP
jgi:hypothetical protein